jgi:hypothetical protein
VTFDDVFVGLQQSGAAIVEGTNAAVQFGGKSSVTIPAGESVVSDPATLGFVGPPPQRCSEDGSSASAFTRPARAVR